jgi:hypothetical protein
VQQELQQQVLVQKSVLVQARMQQLVELVQALA